MKKPIYFPGLNGLRFLAAFAVIIYHIENNKRKLGLPNYFGNSLFGHLGPFAVSLFFVLSGFLISYLLLSEHEKKQTISIRGFYWRRILRIWPVYYLVVALAFAVVPIFLDNGKFFHQYFFPLLTWHLVLLPNLAFLPVQGAQQLWSIGLEEQFYLVWPVLTKIFVKDFWKMAVAVIIIKTVFLYAVPVLLSRLAAGHVCSDRILWLANFIYRAIDMVPFEKMAVGALGAYLVFKKKDQYLKWALNPVIETAAWVGAAALLIIGGRDYLRLAEGVVFTLIILNTACKPKPLFNLENRYFRYLGKISYGIYMYHCLVIAFVLMVLQKYTPGGGAWFNTALYISSIGLSLAAAALSYWYFESYFLGLKKKAQVVASEG